jgi:dTDP-4-amino-4,6-dideoxygalactose transaminase
VIPIADLKAQHAALQDEVEQAVVEVLRGGEYILGPAVRDLEQQLAAYCQCRFGVGVASGTDAIRLALDALGIGPGDEVLTTPFTFIGTSSPVTHCGARPVFVDIDPVTYNLNPQLLEAARTAQTRAVLPVHLYGQPAAMDSILDFARRHDLRVLEDCAQALGACHGPQAVGSLGQAGCLSFFPTKNLGAAGDGGMVVTNDAALAERVDVLRRQGSKRKYHAELPGYNSRLDTLQAAILRVKFKHLGAWNQKRQRLAHAYRAALAGLPLVLPSAVAGTSHVYHQFTVRTPRRDALAEHLKARGIGTMVYYPVPLHLQPLYSGLGYGPGSFPESERAAQEVLSLPMGPELDEAGLQQVVSAIHEFFS